MRNLKYWALCACCAMGLVPAMTACNGIDDDLSDCGKDVDLLYRMRLITNMETEIDSVLCEAGDQPVANALRQTMRQYFNDKGHDLDLSFYDRLNDGTRLLQQSKDMGGATQASYTIYLEQADYRHTAVANLAGNGVAEWLSPEWMSRSKIQNQQNDTIDSHRTGFFTGRHNVLVGKDGDRLTGIVDMYMANDAAAVVIDTTGVKCNGMKAYIEGLGNGFQPADSLYSHGKPQVVRTLLLPVSEGKEVCYYGMGFPSPDTATRVTPSDVKVGSYWSMTLLVWMPDGTITRNDLYVHEPLKAANLKIIKLKMEPTGEVTTVDAEVGVSVQLNWEDGLHFEQPTI